MRKYDLLNNDYRIARESYGRSSMGRMTEAMSRMTTLKNLVIKYFTSNGHSYKSGDFHIEHGGYNLEAEIYTYEGYRDIPIIGIITDWMFFEFVVQLYDSDYMKEFEAVCAALESVYPDGKIIRETP